MLLDWDDMEFLRGNSGAENESLWPSSPSLVTNLLQFSDPNFRGSVFQLPETLFEGGALQFFGSNFRGKVLQFLFGRVSFPPKFSNWLVLSHFKLSLRPKLPSNSFFVDFCLRGRWGQSFSWSNIFFSNLYLQLCPAWPPWKCAGALFSILTLLSPAGKKSYCPNQVLPATPECWTMQSHFLADDCKANLGCCIPGGSGARCNKNQSKMIKWF